MGDKRFYFNGCTNCIEFDGKSILCDSYGDELADVMNDLNDLNEQLKQKNDNLIKISAMTQVRNDKLKDENEQLRNRLKDWHQRTFKAHEYFNILEKVIDEVCDDNISNQIWKEYGKKEKLIE